LRTLEKGLWDSRLDKEGVIQALDCHAIADAVPQKNGSLP